MAVFGDFALNPPQLNYYTLAMGDQAASITACAAAYQALADAISAEIASMGTNVASTAVEGWQGLGGTAMTESGTEIIASLGMAVAYLNEASAIAAEVATAYHTTLTSMIPGPLCDNNRDVQLGLIHTNFMGFNTPAIGALEGIYQEFWLQNATLMGSYQAVVAASTAALAVPPPLAPPTSNPATVAASAAGMMAQEGAESAVQAGYQGMSETASATGSATGGATSQVSGGTDMVQQMLPTVMQGATQFSQVFAQIPQMLGQLPQMLGQGVSQLGGMLGQTADASALTGAGEAAPVTNAANFTSGAPGAGAGGGGGGMGLGGGSGLAPSTYTRPVSSFSAPSQPKLPGTWNIPEETAPTGPRQQPGGFGGGGLYGAPSAMNRGEGSQGEKAPARSMQLTGRGAASRGEHH
jgi:PPE-repeat protein